MTRLLGILIAAFVIATVYMTTTVSQRQEVLRHVAHHNDAWAVSQSVAEFMRLEAMLASHFMSDETASLDEVRLRLDIVFSRLASFDEDKLKAFLEASPKRLEIVTKLRSVISDLDTELDQMDRASAIAMINRMHELNGPLTQLSSQSVQQGWADIEANLESLEELHQIYGIVVAFLIFAWCVLILLQLRQNRLLTNSQKQAEVLNSDLVSASKELQEKNRSLEYVAHHDALTQLPNRILFWAELENALRESRGAVNLMLIDLNDFKSVNDTLGHDFGDLLLNQVSQRMREFDDKVHIFCRLGGDEFACLIVGKDDAGAENIAHELAARIAAPHFLMNRKLEISCSIGISSAHDPQSTDAQTMFKQADIALYRAKDATGQRICLFEEFMQREFDDRKALENDLRLAVQRNEFELLYQAQVDVMSLELRGLEALVRWNHPTRGQIPPGLFVSLAEELGLINELGHIILVAACTEAATWMRPLKIAVNLSPLQLQAPDFVQSVVDVLKTTGLPAERLELEITETVLLDNRERVVKILNELRALGLTIAMDDFGTGYSSLAILRDIPFDTIKLDKSFVRDIAENPQAASLVKLVVDVGTSLNKTVIIEGVETRAQHERIRQLGGPLSQGFLFARPVRASKLGFLHQAEQHADLIDDFSH
ncbi:putative bifunctional diguanylate cyclase/phosphodiesterase [Paracoccus laeviglucosivorans]|uniref:Diguanylate cyclase/phosphodiesterase n=1 Tax=Paracoccus laeviglucosivorans TaxID=1197861 RepID=A0A521FL93_9RHOB|nr:EAL domain-containing protein [Paracoccus laeviglucosivorans]SMO96844.1 diguanylate cyclase/phosphodiesterase [Paracoccus laeviglucosivorans]